MNHNQRLVGFVQKLAAIKEWMLGHDAVLLDGFGQTGGQEFSASVE